MPPKRKTETIPEPSPPAKKRATKVTEKKKRVRETDEQDAATRVRRKKKSVDEDSVVPELEVVSTPKKRTVKAKKPVLESPVRSNSPLVMPKSSLKSASKPRTTNSRKSIVRMNLPPEPTSAERGRSASITATPPSSVKIESISLGKSEVAHRELVDNSADDLEIVSLWNQTWGALYLCLTTIGPVFLTVILVSYALGTLQQSQAIATVGVVYTLLFLTIMGSYSVVILPCILISRVFTSIVSPHTTSHSTEEINLYSRLLVLLLAAGGLGYYFFQNAFVN